jgi:hypothetical protein
MLPSPHIEATIAGEVKGQVAVGSYIVQNNVDHGGVVIVAAPGEIPAPRPRRLPVRLTGRPLAVVGRADEMATIDQHLGPTCPVLLHGPPGIGKTALLKRAVHDYGQRRAQDSVIYHSAISEPLPDTLQFLFDALYECDIPFKPADAQLRHALADAGGLVALDDMVLDRDQFTAVLDTLPQATLLLASERRCLMPVGRAVPVGALLPDDALALLAHALGRPLEGLQATAGRRVTAMLGHEPLGILQLAALVSTLGHELPRLEAELERAGPPQQEVVQRLVSSLDDEERQVLETLGAVAGAALTAEHLARLTGLPEVTPKLDALIRLHLAQAHSPRYSTRVDVRGHDLSARLALALEAKVSDQEAVAGMAGAALRSIEAAEARSDWPGVRQLGRAAESALIMGRRWGAWALALEAQLRAATAVGDGAAEAWARHQLGTRALCLGDAAVAEEQLSRALALRRDLGDDEGARATQHNLDLLRGARGASAFPSGRRSMRRRVGVVALVLVALAVAVALALAVNRSSDPPGPGVVVAARPLVEFGTQELGSRGPPLVLELVNHDARPSRPVRLVVEGPDKGDFGVDESACATVGPGRTCQVRLTFSPSGPGTRRATLWLAGEPRPLAHLTGQGAVRPAPPPGPLPRVEPSMLDFGELPIAGPGRSGGAAVVNAGEAELGLLGIAVVGDASADFTATLDCPTMRVGPGGTCAIGVVFSPGGVGSRTARLEISLAGSGPLVVSLLGFGIEVVGAPPPVVGAPPPVVNAPTPAVEVTVELDAPIIEGVDAPLEPPVAQPVLEPALVLAAVVDPTVVEFGNQPVGEMSDARSAIVTNTGTGDLVMGQAVLAGSGAGEFALVFDGCSGVSVAPGEGCAVDLAFAPIEGGPVSAALELPAVGVDVLTVQLEGRGTRDDGATLVSVPPAVAFPETAVGDLSTSTVLVLNTGGSPVTIESVVVDGDEDFSVEGGACLADQPVELEPAEGCEVLVVFAPAEPGPRTGSLVVAASGADPVLVPLEGSALAEP